MLQTKFNSHRTPNSLLFNSTHACAVTGLASLHAVFNTCSRIYTRIAWSKQTRARQPRSVPIQQLTGIACGNLVGLWKCVTARGHNAFSIAVLLTLLPMVLHLVTKPFLRRTCSAVCRLLCLLTVASAHSSVVSTEPYVLTTYQSKARPI